MREILFRGKAADNGEWVEGDLVQSQTDCHIWSMGGVFFTKVDPETVSEYTGLRDKNGKRIFEGDIVEFDVSSGKTKDTVIWDYGEYNGVTGFRLKKYALFSITETNSRYFEVIGNKWDNPELLEV